MQCKSLAKIKYINIYINLVVQAKFVAFAKLICGIKCRESSRKGCYYYISLQTTDICCYTLVEVPRYEA